MSKKDLLSLPSDLILAQREIFAPNQWLLMNFKAEVESQEYCASEFELNHLRIKYREAKITPTKIGQFVTLWKRFQNGSIMPFDLSDPFDLIVISVRSYENVGQFIFPKDVLHHKGVISKNGIGGKRAIRVYPPWDITESKQAKATLSMAVSLFL